MPPELRPAAPTPAPDPAAKTIWWIDIVKHWDLVVCDMSSRYGIDLYDPAVQARPWPGIRTMIFGLLQGDGLLARALRR